MSSNFTNSLKKHYSITYYRERNHLDPYLSEAIKMFIIKYNLKKIIDVGCGAGHLVKYLNNQGCYTVGCDPITQAVKMAHKINPSNKIIQASANNLPFSEESFDLITAISLIEHLEEPDVELFFHSAYNILRPGGFIFLITPNYFSPFRLILGKKWFGYKDPTHITFFNPLQLKNMLGNSKFVNITTSFKSPKNIDYNPNLPIFMEKWPISLKNFINFCQTESPLSFFRDNLWISAKKPN